MKEVRHKHNMYFDDEIALIHYALCVRSLKRSTTLQAEVTSSAPPTRLRLWRDTHRLFHLRFLLSSPVGTWCVTSQTREWSGRTVSAITAQILACSCTLRLALVLPTLALLAVASSF